MQVILCSKKIRTYCCWYCSRITTWKLLTMMIYFLTSKKWIGVLFTWTNIYINICTNIYSCCNLDMNMIVICLLTLRLRETWKMIFLLLLYLKSGNGYIHSRNNKYGFLNKSTVLSVRIFISGQHICFLLHQFNPFKYNMLLCK